VKFGPAVLTAYVDGELEEPVAARIRAEARRNGQLADAIARLRSRRWQGDTRFAAGRDLAGSAPVEDARPKVARRERFRWASAAITTTCIALYASQPWAPAPDISWQDGQLVADGNLKQALDDAVPMARGIAGEGWIADAATISDEGDCRSFETTVLRGLACRDSVRWVIVRVSKRDFVGASEHGPAIAVTRMTRRDPRAVPDVSDAPSSGLD
jgi:hypothetical protein